jgi:hypothetical protein
MQADASMWSAIAAWVEAVGAIAAVVGSGWVAASESRATRRREERADAEARKKEERTALATQTAALNLAILASTQIHDLHVLLKDEAWRGRVTRVSPSHVLLGTERMLTAFPIQSLGDAPAMVEFSRPIADSLYRHRTSRCCRRIFQRDCRWRRCISRYATSQR